MFHLEGIMKERRDKILDVAILLAEEGGFENVRQRDVAAKAGVALGTLYKSFRSKEDILSAALERQAALLERRMEKRPASGATAMERVVALFQIVTRGMLRKPNYARAVVRAMASGVPEIAANVAAYQGRMNGLIIAALRGVGRLSFSDAEAAPPSADERALALMLQQLWFAGLVGWSAGLHGQSEILEQMDNWAERLLRDYDQPEAQKTPRAPKTV